MHKDNYIHSGKVVPCFLNWAAEEQERNIHAIPELEAYGSFISW